MSRRTLVIHDASPTGNLGLTPEDAYEMMSEWSEHDPTFRRLELTADETILEDIPDEFDVLVSDAEKRPDA